MAEGGLFQLADGLVEPDQFLVLAKASPQVARMPQHHGEQIQPPPKVRLGQELHLEMGKVADEF